jgi:exopolysaccharide production protein ExoQ
VLGMLYPDRITELGDDISQKNAWHGITHSKNLFGMMASVGTIFCFNWWLTRRGGFLWSVGGTIAGFACLLLSRSNTSLFATLLCLLFMVLVMRVPVIKQRFSTLVVISLAAVLLVTELLIQNVIPGISTILAPITSLTGKDATFSSRTIIWDIIKEHISAAPWLGTGYGAYWTAAPDPNSPSYVFMWRMYFYPTESHNGYLDTCNDLGYVGLACLFAFLVWYIRQALELMRFERSQAALCLALLYQQMVINMSESEWFSRSSTFAIILLASTCMSRALAEYRKKAQPVAGPAPQQSNLSRHPRLIDRQFPQGLKVR